VDAYDGRMRQVPGPVGPPDVGPREIDSPPAGPGERTASDAALPPLVAPGPPLTPDQSERARRQVLLPGFDETAQRRLRAARVLVIGAGGLGCASVPYLAGAGVGTLGIVDDDRVDLSNLHRQVTHTTADLGRMKAGSLAETVHALDPSIRVRTHETRLTSANALELMADYDLVLDGSDNFPTRYLVDDAAHLSGLPVVWGSILQYYGQVSVAWYQHGPGYRDLLPRPPAPQDVPSCAEGGVLPSLCATVGSLMATQALLLITGLGRPLLGRVLVHDALAGTSRELQVRPDPTAQPVTELIDYELWCAGPDGPPSIGAEAFADLLRDGAPGSCAGAGAGSGPALVLDVRSPQEHARLSLRGARLLPLDDLEAGDPIDLLTPAGRADRDDATGTDRDEGTGAGGQVGPGAGRDPDRPVYVHCARGPRSVRAAEILRAHGLTDVRYVRGGIDELVRVAPDLVVGGPEPVADVPEGDEA
jgi:molybdopterin/thiamine biosynthesis adenylyltransferase/rhodanese-related sulfurtransferase